MTTELDALKLKVQGILADRFNGVGIDKDGDYTFRHESARVFVRCRDWGDGDTLVTITAPILFRVPRSPELLEWVALKGSSYVFGAVFIDEPDDQSGLFLGFRHSLLGNFLDAEELALAAVMVLRTANDLDDDLKARFGGERMHEDA